MDLKKYKRKANDLNRMIGSFGSKIDSEADAEFIRTLDIGALVFPVLLSIGIVITLIAGLTYWLLVG